MISGPFDNLFAVCSSRVSGCLKLDNLKCVLVDWYHRDLKQRQFHTVPEVSDGR